MCFYNWISNIIPLLHLLTCVVRHHSRTANIFEPQGLWHRHFKYKFLWILAGILCVSVVKSVREPYKINWSSPCLRPLRFLSIGPSRSVILKHNFSFEKLSAVHQLQQNIFGILCGVVSWARPGYHTARSTAIHNHTHIVYTPRVRLDDEISTSATH